MVSDFVRKTNRQDWDQENMMKAIHAVVSTEMGYKSAAERFNIKSKTTLARRVKMYKQNPDMELCCMKGLGSFSPVFGPKEEQELIEYLKKQELLLHGLTGKELRILVYQLAEINKIQHPFSDFQAGKGWLRNFFKRHPQISFRKPEATSTARALGFNKIVNKQFFDLWDSLVLEYHFSAERIFNVDEMGVTTIPKYLGKIIATKGRKQVGQITSGERGQLITVELCVCAAGSVLPPLFVYPRKINSKKFLEGAVKGSWSVASGNGWMRAEHFLEWLKWFASLTEPTVESPVALVLDGSSINSYNLQALEYARKHHIHIICLPPHSTHRMQPLHVSMMKPVSTAYGQEIKTWQREHGDCNLSIAEVAALFSKALTKAARPESILSGFRKTGIWPNNRLVFNDEDFMPSTLSATRVLDNARHEDHSNRPDTQTPPRETPTDEPADDSAEDIGELNRSLSSLSVADDEDETGEPEVAMEDVSFSAVSLINHEIAEDFFPSPANVFGSSESSQNHEESTTNCATIILEPSTGSSITRAFQYSMGFMRRLFGFVTTADETPPLRESGRITPREATPPLTMPMPMVDHAGINDELHSDEANQSLNDDSMIRRVVMEGPLFYSLSSDSDTEFPNQEEGIPSTSTTRKSARLRAQTSVWSESEAGTSRQRTTDGNSSDEALPEMNPGPSTSGYGIKFKEIQKHQARVFRSPPEEIMPLSVAHERTLRKRRRAAGKPTILTSSEHLEFLKSVKKTGPKPQAQPRKRHGRPPRKNLRLEQEETSSDCTLSSTPDPSSDEDQRSPSPPERVLRSSVKTAAKKWKI